MPQLRGGLLRNLVVTAGAVTTFRQTGFGAGCGNCCVGDHVVPQLRGDLLRDLIIAARAVAALGQAGLGAGRGDGGIGDHVMPQLRRDLLRNLIVAAGAVATFRQTGFGAGCGNCCVGDHVVAELRRGLLRDFVVAAGAVAALGQASFGAGRGDGRVDYHVVPQLVDVRILITVAAGARPCGVAPCRAGGRGDRRRIGVQDFDDKGGRFSFVGHGQRLRACALAAVKAGDHLGGHVEQRHVAVVVGRGDFAAGNVQRFAFVVRDLGRSHCHRDRNQRFRGDRNFIGRGQTLIGHSQGLRADLGVVKAADHVLGQIQR